MISLLRRRWKGSGSPASICRFYAKMGFSLGSIVKYAYASHPELRDEATLLWYMDL